MGHNLIGMCVRDMGPHECSVPPLMMPAGHDLFPYLGHDSFIYGTWPHSYVCVGHEASRMLRTTIGDACWMNESCPTHEWVTSQIWMSLVPYMIVDMRPPQCSVPPLVMPDHCWCLLNKWVMSHAWMSHFAHLNESCPKYEWVMSHM